ncbi:MAG TPA: helix-turn-helix transcriptional regulator [Armatimonadota bacterium]|jgi:predicted XRE-type DNA-binding protein|nr:helix-turn-helix transcriptional regulator [Armatimonadota bacterium]
MEYVEGSGNVFADLGMAAPDERLAKTRVAYRIHEVIVSTGLTQAQVARLTGLTQPNISNITRGKLKGFTLERLFQCLNDLDQDVEIVIRPKKPGAAGAGVYVS